MEVQSSTLEVYPNPSQGIFSLKLKDVNDRIVSVSVEDILGSLTLTLSKGEGITASVDIGNQAAGIYFVHVTTQKKKMFAAKIVKD